MQPCEGLHSVRVQVECIIGQIGQILLFGLEPQQQKEQVSTMENTIMMKT